MLYQMQGIKAGEITFFNSFQSEDGKLFPPVCRLVPQNESIVQRYNITYSN